ncbi:hypothetical protein SDC9_204005 [bioreactor metagenome]|uniref:Uncharacterized protein n=1 Tax=bioreactor metagenome TaxID=1076179 RepID=A0A645IYS6_9ZZZZ
MVPYGFFADTFDNGAFVQPQLDEAFRGQHLKRFAHRRTADAQLFGRRRQRKLLALFVFA